jgi:integrase
MKMAAPWRDPKTGIWKLRRRVPTRYLAVAGKSKVIKISTGTADRKEADRRWPGILTKWAEMEAGWERAANVVTLDGAKAREVAAAWAGWVAAGNKLDTGGAPQGKASEIFDPENAAPERVAAMWDRVEAHVAEALALAGISITPESRPVLLQALQPEVYGAYMQADLRHAGATTSPLRKGDPIATLRAKLADALTPPAVPALPSVVTFGQIVGAWQAVTSSAPRVKGDVAQMFAVLERFLGHNDAGAVTTADLRRWRDHAIEGGLNNNTWNGRISMIKSVFVQAVKDGKLPSNPVVNETLRLSKTKPASPPPYTDAQAALILNACRLEKRASIRWAHWIMAFTGMRVAEVMQLSVSDIRVDEGIHYISINADGPGKSVKTANVRHVPIHAALIREGLLTYAATLPPAGQLFPDKLPDKYGMIGGRSYNIIGRWVRETVGIEDERLAPNHSWRHRMEDELRDHGVDEEVRDRLCGHVSASTGRLYGVKGLALRRLADAVQLLKVPAGVVLPEAAS